MPKVPAFFRHAGVKLNSIALEFTRSGPAAATINAIAQGETRFGTTRYERGSVIVTSNLPFDEWTSVFGSERLTGALLDRLTHHVHILEMNGESYRLRQSRHRRRAPSSDAS
jgi:hypothetical protein